MTETYNTSSFVYCIVRFVVLRELLIVLVLDHMQNCFSFKALAECQLRKRCRGRVWQSHFGGAVMHLALITASCVLHFWFYWHLSWQRRLAAMLLALQPVLLASSVCCMLRCLIQEAAVTYA